MKYFMQICAETVAGFKLFLYKNIWCDLLNEMVIENWSCYHFATNTEAVKM
jgi:hypothetical protein